MSTNRVELREFLLTFMRALESFPVHCWKFYPSGNRHSPGNAGAAASLQEQTSEHTYVGVGWLNPPAINLVDNSISFACRRGCQTNVLFDPGDKVILECPFDELVEKVRC